MSFDRASSNYDATRGYPPAVATAIAEFIASTASLGPQQRLLEAGIGTGRLALPLTQHLKPIFGIDLSAGMMQQLRARQGSDAILLAQADGLALPFADSSFDAILIVHVLHLVDDPGRVLVEVQRVLRPGGMVLDGCDSYRVRQQDPLVAAWQSQQSGQTDKRWQRAQESFGLAGWRADGPALCYDYHISARPRDYYEGLSMRAWSSTWALTDAELARGLAAVSAAVDTHFGGDWDAPYQQAHAFELRVLRQD